MSNKLRVAVYGASDQSLIKQFPGRVPVWGDCEFVINETCKKCDYLFILDSLKEKLIINCKVENTFLCICEPKAVRLYHPLYVKQFGNIVSFRNFPYFKGQVVSSMPLLPWRVGSKYNRETKKSDLQNFLDYDFLSKRITVKKEDKVAIITSNKTMTRGHKKRLDFLKRLKITIPEYIDIYGEGFKFVADKWDIYSKYKYVLALENCREKGYVTEKIFDAYISEAFALYWGAPDVFDYFSNDSFEVVEFNSLKITADKIVRFVDENIYETRIASILQEKKKVLNEYNMFARIAKIVEAKENDFSASSELVIYPEQSDIFHKLKQKYYRLFI